MAGVLLLLIAVTAYFNSLEMGGARLLAEAAGTTGTAPVVHATGSFVHDGHTFQVDVSESKVGDGQGVVTEDGTKVQFRNAGTSLYLMSTPAFWTPRTDARLATYLGGRWVLDSGASFDFSPALLQDALAPLTDVPAGSTTVTTHSARLGSRDALRLTSPHADVYVTTGHPASVLRLVTSTGYRSDAGITDVRLDLDYPATLTVHAPSPAVDPRDPAQLPAQFTVEPNSFRFVNCTTPSGCTMSAVVRNLAGPEVAPATADFQLTKGDGSSLGSCTASIPQVANNQTATVSCTVSSGAWVAFTHVGGQYEGRVTVDNTFYDG